MAQVPESFLPPHGDISPLSHLLPVFLSLLWGIYVGKELVAGLGLEDSYSRFALQVIYSPLFSSLHSQAGTTLELFVFI